MQQHMHVHKNQSSLHAASRHLNPDKLFCVCRLVCANKVAAAFGARIDSDAAPIRALRIFSVQIHMVKQLWKHLHWPDDTAIS